MTSAKFYFLVVLQNHFQVIYWEDSDFWLDINTRNR